MLFTKLTLCSQIRNIVLKVAMNLVFIYLGEECLVITYSASELVLWTPDVILFTGLYYDLYNANFDLRGFWARDQGRREG